MTGVWIQEYRTAIGMELDEFARAVNAYGRRMNPPLVCTISDTLIHMLERVKNCVTHPNIANAIAGYCGATQEQRDMIVAPIHKGTWSLNRFIRNADNDDGETSKLIPNGSRAVYKISMSGEVLAEYYSIAEAARNEKPNEDNIRNRCKRRSQVDFTPDTPYTYRYKDEWQSMSREEQLRDIMEKGEILGIRDNV